MKTLLFPHSFKKIGWTLFPFILIIDIINAIMMHTKLFEESSGMMHQMYEFLNNRSELFTNIAIIGSIICILLIACSKEEVEDEMITHIRQQALLIALYINSAILIVTSLMFYQLDFLYVMCYNMFTLPLIFMAIYLWKMCQLKKGVENE